MAHRPLPVSSPLALSLVAGVLTTVHFPVWLRVVQAAELPATAEVAATGVLVVGALCTLGAFADRLSAAAVPKPVVTAGWTWLGVAFVAFVAVALTEPLHWLLAGGGFGAWLARGLGLALPVLALAGAVQAGRPVVRRVEVPVQGWPAGLDGFTIAQVSDVHVGHTPRALVEWVVAQVNQHDVDLVAITGDLVEGSVEEVGADVAVLQGLRARHGVFFVTGNHEYYAGVEPWLTFLRGLGFRVLRNEAVVIGGAGGSFALLGVDDPFGTLAPGHGTDLAAACGQAPAGLRRVLLAHQPVTVDAAADQGVDLQLSGHTHGGQIWPFGWMVRLVQPYLGGLVKHRGTWLYVHQGTGHWGPPLRLGTTAELALLTLRSA